MSCVCMFDLGCIDHSVARPCEGEEEGEENCYAEGGAQRSPECICLKLHSSAWNQHRTQKELAEDSNGLETRFKNSSPVLPPLLVAV